MPSNGLASRDHGAEGAALRPHTGAERRGALEHALANVEGKPHTNVLTGGPHSRGAAGNASPLFATWDPLKPNTNFGVRFFDGPRFDVPLNYATNKKIGDTWWTMSLTTKDGPPSVGGSTILDISFRRMNGLAFNNTLKIWPVGEVNRIQFKQPVVFKQVFLYFSKGNGNPVSPKTGNSFNKLGDLQPGTDPTGKYQVFNQSNNPHLGNTGTSFYFVWFHLASYQKDLNLMNVPADVNEIHFDVWVTPA